MVLLSLIIRLSVLLSLESTNPTFLPDGTLITHCSDKEHIIISACTLWVTAKTDLRGRIIYCTHKRQETAREHNLQNEGKRLDLLASREPTDSIA